MIKTSIGNFSTEKEAIQAFEEKVKPKEKPKSKLLFILTMPNIGSWNGEWTGADRVYARVRNAKNYHWCKEGNYYYSWGDGWGANVEVRKVTVAEANKYIKKTAGFCGYDWMIDSIIECGQILNTNERNEILKNIGGKNE
jgi:hypothetical protein